MATRLARICEANRDHICCRLRRPICRKSSLSLTFAETYSKIILTLFYNIDNNVNTGGTPIPTEGNSDCWRVEEGSNSRRYVRTEPFCE